MSDTPTKAALPGGLSRTGFAIGTAAILVIVVISAVGGYWFAQRGEPSSGSTNVTASASSDRKVLYWYDPMVPNQRFDKPGKSPFMDMELLPKYADETGGEPGIRIDPTIVQNLGVRLTTVERGTLSQPLIAVGSLVFDQRNIAIVQARTSGFVARVYARAPGDVIKRGAPLVDLLVPEWAGAQSEFLALVSSGERDLSDAARQRLLLLGMSEELISAIEVDRKPHTTITVRSPIAGTIDALEAREGMTVSAGVTLAKINGLETVWLEAAIPEVQGIRVDVGSSVDTSLAAYPGEVFKGRVIANLPEANSATRTLRLRIELPNREGRLRPGMFAQVRLAVSDKAPALLVASESVIHTGTRDVVIVAGDQGRFIPTEVQVGAEAGGRTLILDGLKEGQKVVASGQFLIDSEASLKGTLSRLGVTPDQEMRDGMQPHERRP